MKRKIKLDNIKTRHFPLILAIFLTFFLTFVFVGFYRIQEKINTALLEKAGAQKLTLAKAGAMAITDYFKVSKIELLLLARDESVIKEEEEKGRNSLKLLVKHLSQANKALGDIARVNKEGIVIWADNIENNREGEGVFLADRDYFIWAKEQKEPGVFIGKPVFSRGGMAKGKQIVVMATPVLYQGEFNGLILMSFSLNELNKKFVSSLAFSENVMVNIVNENGLFISSTLPQLTQGNMFDLEPKLKEIGRKEGVLFHSCPFDILDKKEKVMTAYTPININGQKWTLLISTSCREILNLVLPLNIQHFNFLTMSLIGLVIGLLIFVFGVRIAHRDGFIDGFENRYKKIKKKS